MTKPIEHIGGMKLAGTEHLMPEYEQRERQLERIVEDMTTEQLHSFALWEIMCQFGHGTSDVVAAELLERSGVSESIAKY